MKLTPAMRKYRTIVIAWSNYIDNKPLRDDEFIRLHIDNWELGNEQREQLWAVRERLAD